MPTNLFSYGISNWIELRILIQYELLKKGENRLEGISDLEIGRKIQLLKEESKSAETVFLTHLIIPTGTDESIGSTFGMAFLFILVEFGIIKFSYGYVFLISISSITLPHAYVMNKFYNLLSQKGINRQLTT